MLKGQLQFQPACCCSLDYLCSHTCLSSSTRLVSTRVLTDSGSEPDNAAAYTRAADKCCKPGNASAMPGAGSWACCSFSSCCCSGPGGLPWSLPALSAVLAALAKPPSCWSAASIARFRCSCWSIRFGLPMTIMPIACSAASLTRWPSEVEESSELCHNLQTSQLKSLRICRI